MRERSHGSIVGGPQEFDLEPGVALDDKLTRPSRRHWPRIAALFGLSALLALNVPSPIRFRNIADAAGVHFVLENSPTPRKHMIETMPGGVAIFDYDGDGRPDIYFTNGAAIPSLEKDSPRYFNRLYRNDGGMKFTDVTREAGVAGAGYAMGVAAADYDNENLVPGANSSGATEFHHRHARPRAPDPHQRRPCAD